MDRFHANNNNNNNLFIYSALFNMLGDQKCITTINNLKVINTNIRNIQIYLISKRYYTLVQCEQDSILSIAKVNKYENDWNPLRPKQISRSEHRDLVHQTVSAKCSSTMFNVFEQLVPVLCCCCSSYTRELFESVSARV